jgi:hypothetical protein
MPLDFLSRLKKQPSSDNAIIVVSGLPRSGTSMMMQILQAGGLQILTDYEREADEDNPKGYYEYERVKQMKDEDTGWLKQAQGKVVKVISALLENLPNNFNYKIIFMERKMDEILASQKQMLIRRGEPTDKVSDETMAELFQKHLTGVKTWLASRPNMKVLYIRYDELLSDPQPHIEAIARFLDLPLNIKAMVTVPDKNLHRQKQ